ncbi:MAG: right-handed parallel beta-helix repeat-containing protein [Ginsengibacter sp.]
MRTFLISILAFIYWPVTAKAKEIPLTKGMVISTSVIIKKGVYSINSDSLSQVITITGNNITIDFNGAQLKGSNDREWPNQFYGTGILIRGGRNIILKNAVINGFKIAVTGSDCERLTIQNCNFSYNYRQKLYSSRLEEDVSDWMSFHHNENDEWMRYGAGIYLRNCNMASIHNNTITGGQCGLMMTACNDGMIRNNNFSYNSGLGIGMYRSSRNQVLNNQLDFNVRGYSHGIFNRGQDSAGILVFEQCNENIFAYNSVTHSGDGFFLWAGQHTMDTGEGGCNDNYIYRNDFSYAPTNGIEVTFSRNIIEANLIKECDNGIWGGYSFNTIISGNVFKENNSGIAIEHGQENSIEKNSFTSDKTAVKLWARKMQPTDWGYAQKRDTRSRQYKITGNSFTKNRIGINAMLTDNIILNGNVFSEVTMKIKTDTSTVIDSAKRSIQPEIKKLVSKSGPSLSKKKNQIPVVNAPHPGRKEIRITNWGPYDYNYPIIWLSALDSSQKMVFNFLGPKGQWKIVFAKGIKNISSDSGKFPATVSAEKTDNNIVIQAQYMGEKFITQQGNRIVGNQPYLFSYTCFDPSISWDVKWYKWDTANDPNKNYEKFKQIFNGTPIKTEKTKKLQYTWWGEIGKQLAADSFATVATGILQVPKGRYELGITADDLVKVFMDGKLLINFWDASKYINDDDAHHSLVIDLDGGVHGLRIEHVENAGFATLNFSLDPIPVRN